jgi:flagellin-like protein
MPLIRYDKRTLPAVGVRCSNMELKHLLSADEENRAVSPVIGVILMVAITVILAAVIGTFVLGLGDQVQQTSPNAQWNWEGDGNEFSITHEGGDSVNAERLSLSGAVSIDDVTQDSGTLNTAGTNGFPDDVSAGDSLTVPSGNAASGEVRLVWTAEGGGQSSTLTTYDVPTA